MNNSANDWFSPISELQNDLVQMIPGFLKGVVIFILGVIIAFVLKGITTLVFRWGMRFLPRSIFGRFFDESDIPTVAQGAGKVVFYVTLFLAASTVLKQMGLEAVSSWFEGLATYLPNIVVALIILFLGWKLKELATMALNRALVKTDFSYAKFASDALGWAIFLTSALVASEQIGINMNLVVTVSTVLAGVLSGGFVLMFALGAKPTISDILSCYQLHRYMSVGQRIQFGDFSGEVESIGPAFVLLKTEKGEVAIPGGRFRQEATLIFK